MALGRRRGLWGRRDFLSRAGRWGLAGAMVCGAGALLRTLWPRSGQARSLAVTVGRPEDFPVGRVSQRFYEELQIWITRDHQGFAAYLARCTHLGCKLYYSAGADHFQCNCHGSSFDLSGAVLRGPAPRPMERVFIALDSAGNLQVDPSVRYRKERGEWRQPGAFVFYARPEAVGAKGA